jgi:hypothetical protein
MLSDPTNIDPQDCPDCLAATDICRFHLGWMAGWDQASEIIGALVQSQGADS